jgi:hypothetical protein
MPMVLTPRRRAASWNLKTHMTSLLCREVARSNLCGKCSKNDGREYAFYFGKKLGEIPMGKEGAFEIRNVMYEIGGRGTSTVCAGCIRKKKLSYILKTLGALPAAAIAAGGLILMPKGVISQLQAYVILACIIVVLAGHRLGPRWNYGSAPH